MTGIIQFKRRLELAALLPRSQRFMRVSWRPEGSCGVEGLAGQTFQSGVWLC